MSGINKVIILGNVGNIESFYTRSGNVMTKVSIATSDRWKDKQSGEWQEVTDWHNVTIFGKPAEFVENYVKKGNKLYIEGQLKTTKTKDKNGDHKYYTNIIARDVQNLSPRDDDGNGGGARRRSGGNGGGARRRHNTSADDYQRASQSSDTLTDEDYEDAPF